MNSVEVATPTSFVVNLSPQDDNITKDEENEQQMQCSMKSDQSYNPLQEEKSAAPTIP